MREQLSEGGRQIGVWPFVAFTGVSFGVGGLLVKGLVDDGVDPFTVTWFPFLVGGLFGLAIGARLGHLRRGAMAPAVVLGLMASAAPALLFNIGFDNLPAGIVTLLISLGPVFTALVAHFVFPDERFNVVKAGGLFMAVIGVGILAAGSIEGDGSLGAIAIVVIGAMAAGGAAVLTRRYALSYGATVLIAPQLTTAGLAALVLSSALGRPITPDGGFESWHIITMIIFGLAVHLGFLSMLRASEVGTTGQVSIIGYCIPVFGVIGGIVVFGDDLTLSLVLGGALIMVSVTVIAVGSRPPARSSPLG